MVAVSCFSQIMTSSQENIRECCLHLLRTIGGKSAAQVIGYIFLFAAPLKSGCLFSNPTILKPFLLDKT